MLNSLVRTFKVACNVSLTLSVGICVHLSTIGFKVYLCFRSFMLNYWLYSASRSTNYYGIEINAHSFVISWLLNFCEYYVPDNMMLCLEWPFFHGTYSRCLSLTWKWATMYCLQCTIPMIDCHACNMHVTCNPESRAGLQRVSDIKSHMQHAVGVQSQSFSTLSLHAHATDRSPESWTL